MLQLRVISIHGRRPTGEGAKDPVQSRTLQNKSDSPHCYTAQNILTTKKMQVEEGNLLFKSIERQTQLQRRGLDRVTGTSSAETHHHLFRLKCIITFMCKSARVLTGLDWTGLFPHLCSVEHVHRIRRRRRRGS